LIVVLDEEFGKYIKIVMPSLLKDVDDIKNSDKFKNNEIKMGPLITSDSEDISVIIKFVETLLVYLGRELSLYYEQLMWLIE